MTEDGFVQMASGTGPDTRENRSLLLEKFDQVHENVECAHGVNDALHMAHYCLANQKFPGPLTEFGCYKGGMSCKLSHVAKLLNKKYVIFDTFEGLPSEAIYKFHDDRDTVEFRKGQYCGEYEEVSENLKKYGAFEYCALIKGKIEDTLPKYQLRPSHVFVDVDIIETALFVIKNMWPLITGPWLFTHEACISEYMQALMNPDWWQENFGTKPPLFGHQLYGFRFGLHGARCLNCLIK